MIDDKLLIRTHVTKYRFKTDRKYQKYLRFHVPKVNAYYFASGTNLIKQFNKTRKRYNKLKNAFKKWDIYV